jgi:hypothetical protein
MIGPARRAHDDGAARTCEREIRRTRRERDVAAGEAGGGIERHHAVAERDDDRAIVRRHTEERDVVGRERGAPEDPKRREIEGDDGIGGIDRVARGRAAREHEAIDLEGKLARGAERGIDDDAHRVALEDCVAARVGRDDHVAGQELLPALGGVGAIVGGNGAAFGGGRLGGRRRVGRVGAGCANRAARHAGEESEAGERETRARKRHL